MINEKKQNPKPSSYSRTVKRKEKKKRRNATQRLCFHLFTPLPTKKEKKTQQKFPSEFQKEALDLYQLSLDCILVFLYCLYYLLLW